MELQRFTGESRCLRIPSLRRLNRPAPSAHFLSLCELPHTTLVQDPGRVWPGKKMAGHLGNERVTTQNLRVLRVDSALDLIFVKGCIPGVDDAQVMVKDSRKIMHNIAKAQHARGIADRILPKGVADLPFPAGTKELAKELPPVIEAVSPRIKSPFTPQE